MIIVILNMSYDTAAMLRMCEEHVPPELNKVSF